MLFKVTYMHSGCCYTAGNGIPKPVTHQSPGARLLAAEHIETCLDLSIDFEQQCGCNIVFV